MKQKGLVLFIPILLAFGPFSWGHPFQVGEKLVYTLKLIGFPVGTKILQVSKVTQYKGDSFYLLTSSIKGSEFLSLVYDLEDRVESYADIENLYPRLVRIDLREGSLKRELEIEINWEEDKEAIIWNKKEGKRRIEELSSPPLDLLSLLYWIRIQNLKIGNQFEVFLVDSTGKFKKVSFQVSALEKVYTYLGVFSAFVCEQINASNPIKVWFSVDQHHLPLQIQVSTSLGFLTAILREIN